MIQLGFLKKIRNRDNIMLFIFLILILFIHRYIFLYADDLYYSRDAAYGLSNLPHFMVGQLNANGRVWIGVMMLIILKSNIYTFRLFNPLVIMLTVLLIAKISTYYTSNQQNSSIMRERTLVGILCSSLFFIFLPIEIANTTIYYAACAFNYLYPTALAMLYGYTLHKHYLKAHNNKINLWILILAFLVGSSTQQVGAMGVGYTVLISLYFRFARKEIISKKLIPYYWALAVGYGIVTYGSIQRMLVEKQTGHEVILKDVASGLFKINVFSIPASSYVLVICLSCLFWLYHFSVKANKGINFNNIIVLCNKVLGVTLSLGLFGYIYVVLYKGYNIKLFSGGSFNTLLSMFIITFMLVYLISIVYISLLILVKERYPFLFYNSINAIGAQLMLIVVDARFAEAYKIMFPSLLLMSVFIVYSSINFYRSKLFLLLAMLVILFSLIPLGNSTFSHFINSSYVSYIWKIDIFIGLFLAVIIIKFYNSHNFKVFMALILIGIGLLNFGTEYRGYKIASYAQDFNLNAIEQYHLNNNPNVLMIKKTQGTMYGYNVNNWNKMPYFMKQCYGIPEQTLIRYID